MTAVAASPEGRTRHTVSVKGFPLECGVVLEEAEVALETWGELNAVGSNGVLVCHALTGSADVADWWPALLGPGRALDPDHDFVICTNVLGSCYGTTGPATQKPGGGGSWGPDFPPVTIRDMVRLQAAVLDRVGVGRLRLALGGSLGGMQVLEWAVEYGDRLDAAACMAAPARQSAWGIALCHSQREAIRLDPRWNGGRYLPGDQPREGLGAARAMAMCTYRSWESLERRFGRDHAAAGGFEVESYLRYQGEKLADRFDANTYMTLTRAMDSHDVGRGRGGVERALAGVTTPLLVVAVDSDVLFPPEELWQLADLVPGARLEWLASPHGHDAFLVEMDEVNEMVRRFRREVGELVGEGV